MKRLLLISFGLISLLFVGYELFNYYKNRNFYKQGESDNFKIRVGEQFTIQLNENASTGFGNCWTNKNKSRFIKLIDKNYKSSQNEKRGQEGSGGRILMTFEGTSVGTDTIRILECPTGILQKDCDYFSEDSTHLQSDARFISAKDKQADYIFVVTVSK